MHSHIIQNDIRVTPVSTNAHRTGSFNNLSKKKTSNILVKGTASGRCYFFLCFCSAEVGWAHCKLFYMLCYKVHAVHTPTKPKLCLDTMFTLQPSAHLSNVHSMDQMDQMYRNNQQKDSAVENINKKKQPRIERQRIRIEIRQVSLISSQMAII